MTQAYAQLLEVVQQTRRSWRARRTLEGLVLLAAAAVGVALVGTWLDHLLHLGRPARSALALIGWIALAAVAWRAVIRPATVQHSDDYFAALLEQRLPSLGNRLINALQLGRDPQPAAPRLVEVIVVDGVRATDDLDPGVAAASPALRRHAFALGAALTIAVVYVLIAGPAARTSFMRMLLPTANIAPFTWTKLSVELEPDGPLLKGDALRITATTAGRVADEARLHVTTGDNGDGMRTFIMQRTADGTCRHEFPAVTSAMSLHVTAGDAGSATFEVAVHARPRIETMSVTYTPPAYTGQPPHTPESFDGHLHGLPQTRADLRFSANKPLEQLILELDGEPLAATALDDVGRTWQATLTLGEHATYRLHLRDTQGYAVDAPAIYTITLDRDAAPAIAFTRPGRDLHVPPNATIPFALVAQDDFGLGRVELMAQRDDADEVTALHAWPSEGDPQRKLELELPRTIHQLGLAAGQRLTYWAVAYDRNDITGPGRAETRKFHLLVLSPEQVQAMLDKQLSDYARVVAELIRLQRLNRAETAEHKPAGGLIDRQGLIRRQTQQLADVMQRQAFPAAAIIDELRRLAADDMAEVITLLEGARDAATLESGKPLAERSLPVQDAIVESLEHILLRLNRADEVRQRLRKKEETDPVRHREVTRVLDQLAEDLEKFLADVRDMEDTYEKLPKRGEQDQVDGESLESIDDIEHRLDEWKQWAKDSVDAITKLPQGFVPDAYLAENVSTIFEEIEKQPRPPTKEIATPVEEGAKVLAEEVAEDLEMWMPHHGDDIKWVMEDPTEGMFQVPEATLPSDLQDMIGDLVEDVEAFDEEADDITGAWGGNMQAGWGIMDGPISSYAAVGKTGNQMPNASEMGGRSGAGRRGRSSGQMVGAESRGLEGRPTPARLTNEPYKQGVPNVNKQLNPRGATGGGKKTGGGQRGLQGGTPPDFVKDMQRLAQHQALLREQAMQVARQLDYHGRPLSQVQRAIDLMEGAAQDLRDLRYDDAARKRKAALDALRAAASDVDQAVTLTLQKATHLPPELREQVTAGARQPMPEGYEDLVGAYYKALTEQAGE